MAWLLALGALLSLLVSYSFSAAGATSYTVGDKSGWTIGVDYTKWAGSKSFKTGDNLVFNYASGQHTVVEVSAADYLACAAANPLGSDSSGATTVPLKSGGKHYFICSISGHCAAGMKLEVTVSGSGSGGSSSSPSSPTPTTPNTPYTTPTTPYVTPTTPYTTTPTAPACSGSTGTYTPATPGTTPFMSYNYNGAAAGLVRPAAALACFGALVCIAIVQLGMS